MWPDEADIDPIDTSQNNEIGRRYIHVNRDFGLLGTEHVQVLGPCLDSQAEKVLRN